MQQLQQESKTHNRREYNLDSTTLIDMFRAILTIASLVGAAAFAPVSQVARSSALKMSFESEIGAQPPLGFWDPLGLLDDADQARFDRLRCVENKHGRISMLAILGHLVTSATSLRKTTFHELERYSSICFTKFLFFLNFA